MNNKLRGLDSLRFFAFLSVFLYHTTDKFPLGYLGVDFFFILSSFLLTFLLYKEINAKGSFSKKNFFARRCLRIYPLYFLVVSNSLFLLPLVAAQFNIAITLPQKKWYYLIFLSNYEPSAHIFALKFLWSISVEEQFYIVFLLVSSLLRTHFWQTILALLTVYLSYSIVGNFYSWDTYYNVFSQLINFSTGILLGNYFFFRGKQPRLRCVFWIFSIALMLLVVLVKLNAEAFIYRPLIAVMFAAIILFSIIVGRSYNAHQYKLFRVTEWLGKYAFGLYVYSGFVITFCIKFLKYPVSVKLLLIEYAITLLVAIISFHTFENKMLRLKRYFN
jgi:peptidoglycan/LPS O-acetylase OafA/YrhL